MVQKGFGVLKVCSTATEIAIGVLIVTLNSTHKQVKIYEFELFLKRYKAFLILFQMLRLLSIKYALLLNTKLCKFSGYLEQSHT